MQRIYSPYTERGAIKGLLPYGPHNVRDVLATRILKVTGSYEQARYARDGRETIRALPPAGQGGARGPDPQPECGRLPEWLRPLSAHLILANPG